MFLHDVTQYVPTHPPPVVRTTVWKLPRIIPILKRLKTKLLPMLRRWPIWMRALAQNQKRQKGV